MLIFCLFSRLEPSFFTTVFYAEPFGECLLFQPPNNDITIWENTNLVQMVRQFWGVFLGFPKPCWFDQCYFFPFFRMCFFDTRRRYHYWRESILSFTWFWWFAPIAETFNKKTCFEVWSWQNLFGWLILIKVRKSNFLMALSAIEYLLRYWPIWNAFLSLSKMDHPSTPCGTFSGFILCWPFFFEHFILFA